MKQKLLILFSIFFVTSEASLKKVDNFKLYENFIREIELRAAGNCYAPDIPMLVPQKRVLIEEILEDFNNFNEAHELHGDYPVKFPGNEFLNLIWLQGINNRVPVNEMEGNKSKILHYWRSLEKNTNRELLPHKRYDCNAQKIFDWRKNVHPDFDGGNVTDIYLDWAKMVAKMMKRYKEELDLCDKIPELQQYLIEYIKQGMRSIFQKYVIELYYRRIAALCNDKCITNQFVIPRRELLANLDEFEWLMNILISDWQEFLMKCKITSTTTTTPPTTTERDLTKIPPYTPSGRGPYDYYDDCWRKFKRIKDYILYD